MAYYKNVVNGRECLVASLHHEVFRTAHHDDHHRGFARTYARTRACPFTRQLTRELKNYLRLCRLCLQYKTWRHKPYGKLAPLPVRYQVTRW